MKNEMNNGNMDATKSAIIAMSLGSWGRGSNINEAVKNLKRNAGRVPAKDIILFHIIGDDKPTVDNHGDIHRAAQSTNIRLGWMAPKAGREG